MIGKVMNLRRSHLTRAGEHSAHNTEHTQARSCRSMLAGCHTCAHVSATYHRCTDMVWRAAKLGSNRIQFVPTHYWKSTVSGEQEDTFTLAAQSRAACKTECPARVRDGVCCHVQSSVLLLVYMQVAFLLTAG